MDLVLLTKKADETNNGWCDDKSKGRSKTFASYKLRCLNTIRYCTSVNEQQHSREVSCRENEAVERSGKVVSRWRVTLSMHQPYALGRYRDWYVGNTILGALLRWPDFAHFPCHRLD